VTDFEALLARERTAASHHDRRAAELARDGRDSEAAWERQLAAISRSLVPELETALADTRTA
jgi:hypothetical protein